MGILNSMTEKMENISRSALYRESAPSSLEDQYIEKGYTYNAERGVWEAPKPTTRSWATKPEKPTNGDLWLDIATGKSYVYYETTTNSDWVQVGGSASGA